MKKWSKKYDSCLNCSTTRFSHRGRGYCKRCHPIFSKIKKVELWDEKIPETWIGWPESSVDLTRDFSKIQKSFIEQCSERLSSIKYHEEKMNGTISGLDLEYKIIEIAKLCGIDGNLLFGHDAGAFESNLDQRERLFIYQKLHSIVESKKWKGIDRWRVFDSKLN